MEYINTSVFELFEIGPGPSSSHTIGPMKAAFNFINTIAALPATIKNNANRIDVYLYGSLSATGLGHSTHKAIAAGLMNKTPSECDAKFLKELFKTLKEVYFIELNNKIAFAFKNIHFKQIRHTYPYQNTLIFTLSSERDILFEKEYYSTGGGFIKYKGEVEVKKIESPHKFANMKELKNIAIQKRLPVYKILLENEIATYCNNKKLIIDKLFNIIEYMLNSVDRGLSRDGVLPGPIGLKRKASTLYKKAKRTKSDLNREMGFINAYAFAASEENADSEIVVTAPTLGACGVIPGILFYLHNNLFIKKIDLVKGLLTAGAIGMIIKYNASISGAEVGCQGEIGSAAAMAAAMLAEVFKKEIYIVEDAAEIALEHHLGLTCDPIDGYVQIPCIERNAVGAIKAYNAFLISTLLNHSMQKLTLDGTIKSMYETGHDMLKKYKETAKGGLAVCYINC